MNVTIDRFEGEFAVCEKADRSIINIKKERLPSNVKEGDVLIIEGDIIKVDSKETDQLKKDIEKSMRNLLK